MTGTIIRFNRRERLLSQVRAYITAVDALIQDGDHGIDLLLKGFPYADDELKVKIVLMLGTLANERVIWPLVNIMCDGSLGETIRQAAAIQISVVGGLLHNTDALTDRLLGEIENPSPVARANAVFALGWEGNLRAASDLIDSLADEDIEVQQAAVNALSNLRDERLFSLLTQRLQQGSKEQQRSILYNLGQFPSRHGDVVRICKTFIYHNDADLRYDALVVLNSVADADTHLSFYAHCLDDDDPRIRELVLIRLTSIAPKTLRGLSVDVRRLMEDRSAKVRQAATRLIHHMDAITLAPKGGRHEPV
jgi:HEAT repeat protein